MRLCRLHQSWMKRCLLKLSQDQQEILKIDGLQEDKYTFLFSFKLHQTVFYGRDKQRVIFSHGKDTSEK